MASAPCSGKRKLILDVDTGIDDALALAYVSTFDDVEIVGVIGTYGNVAAGTAVRNTRYVLDRLGLRCVPVLAGSTHPSWADSFIADAGCAQFHGTDGLGGYGPAAEPPASLAFDSTETSASASHRLISVGGYDVHDRHANPSTDSFTLSFTTCDHAEGADAAVPEGVRLIIDMVRRYGRNVTVVANSQLTDIDAALNAAPDIADGLRLVMMGGTLTQEGNCWDATAETNIIQDPETADRVFHSGADVTMVGLDVTHQCLLGTAATAQWRSNNPPTDVRTFLADIADFSIAANLHADARLFSAGMPLHDPLAAAVALDPSLVECFDLPMKVETRTGDFHGTRGRTIGDPAGLIDPSAPRVHVALTVDHDRFVADFTRKIADIRR